MTRIRMARIAMTLALMAAVLVQAGVAEAAPSLWSITPSPNQSTSNNFLNGVSCTSSTRCVAVGQNDSGLVLIETWNGTSWSVTPSPNPGTSGKVLGVSCTSPTRCVAVGYYGNGSSEPTRTLVETWDGTSWSVTPSPNPGSYINVLYGVSCTSSTRCVAVGLYGSGNAQTLVETWNGTSWSVTPNLGISGSVLNGVSCTSSTSCVAVGHNESGQTLVETWNGTSWSVTPSPNQGTSPNVLNGVSCTSSTSCAAVGSYQNASGNAQTLVEIWNGTSWSVTPSPNPSSGNNLLNGVSCTSSTRCVAVGYYVTYYGSGISRTLVETWNGTSWSVTPSPNQNYNGFLAGVSCTSSTSCMAAGYYGSALGLARTLVETWNGTSWSVTPSPNPGTSPSNFLNGVSCTSSTRCVAVGSYVNGSNRTLVETWNGTSWSVIPSPNPGGDNIVLTGVSCTSSTRCVAVGSYVVNFFGRVLDQTLVETWNGTSWSITPSPNQNYNGFLSGVSCTSSTSCVAVGSSRSYYGSNIDRTLVETWNGTSWSVTPSPNQSGGTNFLTGVSCTSSTSCAAVGYYVNASGNAQTLVETWNGTSWSVTPSPNPNYSNSFLNGVSCTSSTRCVTVGYYVNYYGSGLDRTLVETGS